MDARAGAGWAVLALAAVIGVTRFAGGTPVERGVEGALGAFALAAVLSGPGALALLARRDRPALLLAAGLLLVPLSMVSMAGVTLPLLIPAFVFLMAYVRVRPVAPSPRLPAEVVTAAVIGLVVIALLALLVHQDPRSYTTSIGGGSTSDVITVAEAFASLALVAAALAAGWFGAAPARRRS
jgi:hypothetical protein